MGIIFGLWHGTKEMINVIMMPVTSINFSTSRPFLRVVHTNSGQHVNHSAMFLANLHWLIGSPSTHLAWQHACVLIG